MLLCILGTIGGKSRLLDVLERRCDVLKLRDLQTASVEAKEDVRYVPRVAIMCRVCSSVMEVV